MTSTPDFRAEKEAESAKFLLLEAQRKRHELRGYYAIALKELKKSRAEGFAEAVERAAKIAESYEHYCDAPFSPSGEIAVQIRALLK